jgi:hypothetical protein
MNGEEIHHKDTKKRIEEIHHRAHREHREKDGEIQSKIQSVNIIPINLQ